MSHCAYINKKKLDYENIKQSYHYLALSCITVSPNSYMWHIEKEMFYIYKVTYEETEAH